MTDTAPSGTPDLSGPPDQPRKPPSRRQQRRAHRHRRRPVHWRLAHALWSALVGVFVLCLLTIALFVGLGRSVNAPDWMREDLALRIENSVAGALQFSFGDIELVVGGGWRPRARFRDLRLSQPDGQELLRLADAEVSFSVTALMQGQIRPKTVLVTGAFATLRREADGTVALQLGNSSAAPVEQARSLPELIESWDVALEQPILQSLTALELQALTLRYEDAAARRAWTVDGGSALMQRDGADLRLTGTFAVLSGRDFAATIEANYASRIGDLAAEFGVTVTDLAAEDVASQSVALSWLNILRAPVSGAIRGGIDGAGALGPVNATLQIGAGVLQPTDTTRPIPFQQARSYLTYDPADQSLSFDELSVQSPWVSGQAEGIAYLGGVAEGALTDLVGQFELSDFRLNPDGVYDTPLDVSGAIADFRLELDPFRFKLGQLQITDGDSTILASGTLTAEAEGWNAALNAQVDRLGPQRLLEIWPAPVAVKPRKWVEDNLLAADLEGVNFALRARPGSKPDMYVDFDFQRGEIIVAKWLPPLQGGAGTVTLVDRRFVVTATQGVLDSGGYGQVNAAGTSFIIPDTDAKPDTPGIARVSAEGPIAAVMALLNRPPLSVLKNATLPVDLAQGVVRATGTLALPLKKGTQFEEIFFHVNGRVEDVRSTVLVPGHVVTSDALEVDITQNRVILRGAGQISGVPATVEWTQPIGPGVPPASALVGQVALSPDTVEAFRIGLPPGSVRGEGVGQIRIDLAAGQPPRLRLTSDLKGLGLAIPALGWRKSPGSGGLLEVEARLGDRPEVTRIALGAAALRAEGRITLRPDGGLDRARFSSVRLGNWLSVAAELVGRGAGRPVGLNVTGGQLDMRRANFGSGEGESGPMAINLDRLQITDTIILNQFRGGFRGGKALAGTFVGRLGGRTEVTGEVIPEGGRSSFRIRSEDGGGVLRDAGLLTQARGGAFDLTLNPTGREGEFDGWARIRNTRVINAPAIAAVLDAASIVGLLDELSGSGIQFSDVQARFRIAPGLVTLYESSAEGPSMGLSMDGRYDTKVDMLDMRGVISPLYLVNSIGSVLTARKGEGLIGFNYALRGAAANPRVQVNPLSALAPGPLRDALRGPRPADTQNPAPAGVATEGQTGTSQPASAREQSNAPAGTAPNPQDDDTQSFGGRSREHLFEGR